MSTTVKKIYDLIEEYAPKELAWEGDNVGLLVGSMDADVSGIVFVVDVNLGAINMAVDARANLIISHHPVIFSPLKEITDKTATGKVLHTAIKNDINIICAHTNLDAASEGISQTLAEIAGLKNIYEPDGINLMRVGELDDNAETEDFIKELKNALEIDTIAVSKGYPKYIKKVAVVAGRGCSLLHEAKQIGADILLLGEIKHENAVYADVLGLCVISCGHHETEVIILDRLKTYLQNRLNKLQLFLGVYTDAPMVNK